MKFFRFLFQKELDQAYQRGFEDAKEASAKLCILTPQEMAEGDWSIEACNRVSNNEIWIGMSLQMLKVQKGEPTSHNISNYGDGNKHQWCWLSSNNLQCFYGGDDEIITGYN